MRDVFGFPELGAELSWEVEHAFDSMTGFMSGGDASEYNDALSHLTQRDIRAEMLIAGTKKASLAP